MQRAHSALGERDAQDIGALRQELDELDADAARPAQRAPVGEVEDVVVLDLPANDDAEKLTMGPVVMLYAAQFSCYSW